MNILAHKALLSVYGEGARLVEGRHVRNAVDDTPTASPAWWWGTRGGRAGEVSGS